MNKEAGDKSLMALSLTHDELARKVNEQLWAGYELVGAPFLSEDMMYQSMMTSIIQTSPLPAS
jgi:hypothetical protein